MRKAERSKKTRTALLKAAHRLFAEKGYAETSTQDIVDETEVGRGALHHHFGNKKGIFQAVFEELRAARVQMIQERMMTAEGDLWQRIVEAGVDAFAESLADKSVQRIIFLDGPSVLHSDAWFKNTPAVNLITLSLERLVAEGLIEETTPCDTLGHLLWGAFLEAGLYMTHADDADEARRVMVRGLIHLIEGLRIKPERHAEGVGSMRILKSMLIPCAPSRSLTPRA